MAFLIIGLLIIDTHDVSDVILAIFCGLLFHVDGGLCIGAAWFVRFPHWQTSMLMGLVEIASATLILMPYPLVYAATVPYCIGLRLLISGIGVLHPALRLRKMRPDTLSRCCSRGITPLNVHMARSALTIRVGAAVKSIESATYVKSHGPCTPASGAAS